jgi:sec-independent protein translocase protein TatB
MRLAAAAASPIGDGMFDLAWSEIALIAVVAIVVIGPKDLPDAVRGVARMIRKARQMAAEFHTQADELVREANLHEVRESLNEIRNFNIKDTIERAVDSDGTIRKTFSEDPLRDWPHTPAAGSTSAGAEGTPAAVSGAAAAADSVAGTAQDGVAGTERDNIAASSTPPAFVPPSSEPPAPKPTPTPSGPPAFIPPSAAGKAAGSSTQDV